MTGKEVNALCSWWTPILGTLFRFLLGLSFWAIFETVGIYGILKWSGFLLILGWFLAFVCGLGMLAMTFSWLDGCMRLTMATRRALAEEFAVYGDPRQWETPEGKKIMDEIRARKATDEKAREESEKRFSADLKSEMKNLQKSLSNPSTKTIGQKIDELEKRAEK